MERTPRKHEPAALHAALVLVTMLMLSACQRSTYTSVDWGAFVSRENVLYAVKYTEVSESHEFPFPQRPEPGITSETFDLLEIDLEGAKPVRMPGVRFHIDRDVGPNGDHDYVVIGEQGKPQLWSRKDISEKLRAAAGASCNGYTLFDKQDSRVLYFYCQPEELVYRFEPPYSKGVAVNLGPKAGIRMSIPGAYQFSSVVGDSRLYLWVGDDFLFEIALDKSASPLELDRDAGPDSPLVADTSNPPGVRRRQLPRTEQLLGISTGIRIHEVSRGNSRLEVRVLKPGASPTTYEFKDAVVDRMLLRSRYLARTNNVVWLFKRPDGGTSIVSLNLQSGQFSKSEVPGYQ